jgi:hypothetical protein
MEKMPPGGNTVMPIKRKKTRVTAYRNTDRHCFCQIKFQSGERVIVSLANVPEPGIKVIKILFRVFPKTIWEFRALLQAEERYGSTRQS